MILIIDRIGEVKIKGYGKKDNITVGRPSSMILIIDRIGEVKIKGYGKKDNITVGRADFAN